MAWPDDISAQMLPPHEGEPATLRRDILDELADHLDCAMQRELRHHDDPAQARRAVLERFGSPQRIARQLWLDAMKEQLMNQRIMFGTLIVMMVVVLGLGAMMIISMRQNQRLHEALIARLEATPPTSSPQEAAQLAASFNWPSLKVQVLEHDGAPVADQRVYLQGEPYNPGTKSSMDERTDSDGYVTFGPMRPGIYNLRIHRRGESFLRNVTVAPGPAEPVVVKWLHIPDERVPVRLRLDLPEPIAAANPIMRLELAARPVQGRQGPGIWTWPSRHIVIDAAGRVAEIPGDHVAVRSYPSAHDPTILADLQWGETVDLNPAIQYSLTNHAIWVRASEEMDEATRWSLLHPYQWERDFFTLSGEPHEEIHLRPGAEDLLRQFNQQHIRATSPPVRRR